MFYFALIKRDGLGKWMEIRKDSFEEAEEYVKAYCIVSAPKKKISNYKIISKEEHDNLLAEQKKKEAKFLQLDDRAIRVAENFLNIKLKNITKDTIERFSLKENTEKPYYAKCSWGSGSNGSFCDRNDLVDLYTQEAESNSDEGFDIEVYDIDNDEDIYVVAKVEVKLFVDGKEL